MNTDPVPSVTHQFNQGIIDSLPFSSIVLAPDGGITAVNQAWNTVADKNFPAMKSARVNINYLEVAASGIGGPYGALSKTAREGINDVLKGTTKHFSLEFSILTPTQKHWFLLHAAPLKETTVDAVIVSHFDITSTKQAESVRLETADQFLELSAHLHQVLWIDDLTENRIVYISPAFERVWGRTCQSVYDDPNLLLSTIHPEDRDRMESVRMNQVATDGFNAECRIVKTDGSIRWISARNYRIRDGDDSSKRFVGIAEDITDRKELDERFIQSQKMEVVGHLTDGVAHGFNNLIAVIAGYAELIGQETEKEHLHQRYVEEIRIATMQASSLTQQLLIFSRKQTVRAVLLDLNRAIGEMEEMLRRLVYENIELTFVYGDKAGHVKADPGYLWQLLMNMVVNACDAMESGGKLSIETSSGRLDDSYLSIHPAVLPGQYVLLSITDTGTGMSQAIRSRLFEAFFTTKPEGKGSGLGLATCATIIKQSGGHIDVVTAPEIGTTFNIYFPQIDSPISAAITPVPIEISVATGGTETLLVVEDDPALRKLAQRVLQAKGYKVISASNGREALRLSRDHKGEPISLIITDVVMPQMGGVVMAEWLQTTNPHLKVLFTSGYMEETISQQGIVAGNIEFLPKPYTPGSLLAKTREVLNKEIEVL